MPDWVGDAIWWQVHPLSFTGAEPTALPDGELRHRLPHLQGWLDHLLALGCNGLALGPVSASGTHGYDTVDHFRIDPRLGDEADFDALVAAARERGIRVLLDGVFNHVGRDHPAFRAVVEVGRTPRRRTGSGCTGPRAGPRGPCRAPTCSRATTCSSSSTTPPPRWPTWSPA